MPAAPVMMDLFAEAYRLHLMRGVEDLLTRYGFVRIAGVDEVGRGCLAGPVVAAAERERVAEAIRASSLASAVVQISPDVIDRINILEATRLAMAQALAGLRPSPDCALIDAVKLSGTAFPCFPLIRGDAVSYAIACASILAKVERDRMMVELHDTYPHYGFASHKGYGVAEHLQALATYGPCPIHRLTYRPVLPRPADRLAELAGRTA